MHGIEAVRSRTGTALRVWGKFDAISLPKLRAALDGACRSGGSLVVDLSGVAFLDLGSARELAVRVLIQGLRLPFENPSPGVLASTRALSLHDGPAFTNGPDREEPPVFSGT